MNKLLLTGRLTADPELTETSAGVSVCRFSIAVQRDYKTDGERQTDFFDVTAWRGLAETVAKYSKKGDKVLIEGSVQPRQYEDNKGTKHKVVDVIAQSVEFMTPKAQNTNGESDRDYTDAGHQTQGRRPALQAFDDDGDIPF